MKTAVIYGSKYGTTKQYATWIAEELGAELLERGAVNPAKLADYDCIVYGGGLYAGGISGVELVAKNPCRNLVVFTVGLASPEATDYTAILEKSFPPELRKKIAVFHLRGGIDYKKLGLVHRGMMAMLVKTLRKKPETEWSSDDKALLETYGARVDFTDRGTIAPLVAHVRQLEQHG